MLNGDAYVGPAGRAADALGGVYTLARVVTRGKRHKSCAN
jgi:hypothetical protein